jgi:hypothetical protein
MKRILTLSIAIMMIAGVAAADHIGIYADQAGAGACGLTPPTFASGSLFVVHKTTEATGSEFAITGLATSPAPFTGSVVLNGFLAIGDVVNGLSLAYGGCVAGPAIAAVQLNFFGTGNPAACNMLQIVPSPTAGGIIKAVNCSFAELPATGGKAYINPNGTCTDCAEPAPNATEESTWGKVKSLYR